jgi:hypothetical protein
VFCSFLALVLKKALEDRIVALGRTSSWPEIIADLGSLTETASASSSAQRRVPPPVSLFVRPALTVREPPPADPPIRKM